MALAEWTNADTDYRTGVGLETLSLALAGMDRDGLCQCDNAPSTRVQIPHAVITF